MKLYTLLQWNHLREGIFFKEFKEPSNLLNIFKKKIILILLRTLKDKNDQ